MNIGMILNSNFPPDIRVEKEANSLIKHGFNVYIISLLKNNVPQIEYQNNICIFRIPPQKKIYKRALNMFLFHLSFIDFYWKRQLKHIINEFNIHALHIHDLPLVKTAVIVSQEFKIPVIADLHENYPEALKLWGKPASKKRRLLMFMTPNWRWKLYERDILQKVEKIITVVAEGKEHYLKDCNVNNDKIVILMNTVDLPKFNKVNIKKKKFSQYTNNFIITYIGGFGPHRGIETVIKSIPLLIKKIPNIKLLLVGGKGSRYFESLKIMCASFKLQPYIEFISWVDQSYIPSYISLSNICLVPHNANPHTNTTIPHKLFQYMSMEKPVIVTDCNPLKRIVQETSCGIVFPSGDHKKLADAIYRLYSDPLLSKKLGINGKKAVIKKYSWKYEEKKLIEFYSKLEALK